MSLKTTKGSSETLKYEKLTAALRKTVEGQQVTRAGDVPREDRTDPRRPLDRHGPQGDRLNPRRLESRLDRGDAVRELVEITAYFDEATGTLY